MSDRHSEKMSWRNTI